jgi:hypothetical protein
MTQVFKDPTLPTALALREQFPTPYAIATATLSALAKLRIKHSYPSNAKLMQLQQLAAQSIGTKDLLRQRGLVLEQAQFIRELRMLQEHIQQLDKEIRQLVERSREGQILTSIPGIGIIQAAAIMAAIGTILNFERASELKSYFGWAPVSAHLWNDARPRTIDAWGHQNHETDAFSLRCPCHSARLRVGQAV